MWVILYHPHLLISNWVFDMNFNVEESELEGVLLIQPAVYSDPRGRFFESFQKERYKEIGIEEEFVQDNQSVSQKNTIRGLHYRDEPGQSKLVRVIHGEVLDVVVDAVGHGWVLKVRNAKLFARLAHQRANLLLRGIRQ